MTKIIGGSSCRKIARDLSADLSIDYIDATVARFADQELRIQLPSHLYEDDVIIVQSTCKPANDHLMELLLLIDAVKRAGSRRIIAVIPYFGYSRQDRPSYEYGPISARLVAKMLETAGANHIITLDLHSKQLGGFFEIGIQDIDPTALFASAIEKFDDLVVVSPDVGGLIRARRLANVFKCNIAIINKTRKEHNSCDIGAVIGDVAEKDCVIIDDIVDTGETLNKAATLLKNNGAKNIQVAVSHAVLSNNALQKLTKSSISKIITTNSILQNLPADVFKILDIVPLFSNAIRTLMKI